MDWCVARHLKLRSATAIHPDAPGCVTPSGALPAAGSIGLVNQADAPASFGLAKHASSIRSAGYDGWAVDVSAIVRIVSFTVRVLMAAVSIKSVIHNSRLERLLQAEGHQRLGGD